MTDKIQGSVKWFSNKKGYGFITPFEGSTISEDIFVHQSAIHSDGYRTLDEEWQVAFEVGYDDDGKPKAENVTAIGGGPCTGPRKSRYPTNRRGGRQRRREPYDENDGGEGGENAPPPKREPQPVWHDMLSEEVKQALTDKQIRTTTGTIDVSVDKARIKLGTRGYASMAHEDKILAEGTFDCDPDGNATFEWKRAIFFTDDQVWNVFLDLPSLLADINLTDESVKAVGVDETMYTLMGESTADPKSTLAASGFEMRRVVLTTKRR
jgi:cold shock CspA family protein